MHGTTNEFSSLTHTKRLPSWGSAFAVFSLTLFLPWVPPFKHHVLTEAFPDHSIAVASGFQHIQFHFTSSTGFTTLRNHLFNCLLTLPPIIGGQGPGLAGSLDVSPVPQTKQIRM